MDGVNSDSIDLDRMKAEGKATKMAQTATLITNQTNSAVFRVDFNHTELCTDCNPVTCTVKGESVHVGTWRDLLVDLVEMFIAKGNSKICDLSKKPLLSGSNRPFLLKDKPNGAAKQITVGYWIYVNFNIATIVDIIGKLFRYCGVNLDNVEITYTPKNSRHTAKREAEQRQARVNTVSGSAFDEYTDIVDFEIGKDCLRNILNTHFNILYDYSNINILWDAAQNEIPMFLNDNAINSADDLWRLVICAFRRELALSNPHIWRTAPPYPTNVRGIVINLARQHGGTVTRSQIDEYFLRIKIASPINRVLLSKNELLFFDKERLILTDVLNLNTERRERIANALKGLFEAEEAEYIILRDIQERWFLRLPELSNGIKWTSLLLQETLRVKPSIGYRPVEPSLNGQMLDTLRAAIVPNNSFLVTFADVTHRYCYEKYNLPHSIGSEDLRLELRNAGMIEGNELIHNMHKALNDHRFAFDNEKMHLKILER